MLNRKKYYYIEDSNSVVLGTRKAMSKEDMISILRKEYGDLLAEPLDIIEVGTE